MNVKKILPLVAFAVLACYTTPGHPASGPEKPKKISYKEASAFESALLARESTAPKVPAKPYVQPVNKAEACKLPTSQDKLILPNLRAYWDGECKNGFAFGLGRDIAISDTYRIEEITVHDGTGDDSLQPRVDYDYVNNTVAYMVGGSRFPAHTFHSEQMVDSISGFNAYQTLTIVDENAKVFAVYSSAFGPVRYFVNTRTDNAIAYKFTDSSAAPVTDQNAAIFAMQIVDPKNNTTGVTVVHYANGANRHFMVSDGKTESVLFPTDYADHVYSKYLEVANAASQANANLQGAKQNRTRVSVQGLQRQKRRQGLG